MQLFVTFQAGLLLFAVASAFEEAAFTFPFRELGNDQFPFETKFKQLRIAHRAGAFGVGMILLAVAFAEGFFYEGPIEKKILAGFLCAVACGLVYTFTFDPVYAKRIGQHWFYLGGTAQTDNNWKKLFGIFAGELKAIICLAVIIGINLLFKNFM